MTVYARAYPTTVRNAFLALAVILAVLGAIVTTYRPPTAHAQSRSYDRWVVLADGTHVNVGLLSHLHPVRKGVVYRKPDGTPYNPCNPVNTPEVEYNNDVITGIDKIALSVGLFAKVDYYDPGLYCNYMASLDWTLQTTGARRDGVEDELKRHNFDTNVYDYFQNTFCSTAPGGGRKFCGGNWQYLTVEQIECPHDLSDGDGHDSYELWATVAILYPGGSPVWTAPSTFNNGWCWAGD